MIIGLLLNDTCLKEGSTVSLRCEIKGLPYQHPSVEFRQNGIEIVPGRGKFKNFQLQFHNQARQII